MAELYDNIAALCAERGIRPGRVCADLGLSRGLMTDLKMGRKKTLNAETIAKIAAYLGVPVETLLTGSAPVREVTDEELKFALFGGGSVTDEQFEEVKRFARFVKERDALDE